MSFPGGSLVNNRQPMQETQFRSLGWENSGEVNDNPLQFSRLEKSLHRGAWQATVQHKSVRQNLVTMQQHSFYMKCKEK